MACGCLLVASDTSPVREFVEDGVTGLLVPPHDPAALAARLAAALDGGDALRRMRARARAKVVGELDAQRVIWPRKRAWLEAAVASPGAPAPARAGPAGRRR